MQMNINLSGDANEFSQAILENYTLSVYAYSELSKAYKTPRGEFLGLHFNFKNSFDGGLPGGLIAQNFFNLIYLPAHVPCHLPSGDFMAVTIHFQRKYIEQFIGQYPMLNDFLHRTEKGFSTQVGLQHFPIAPEIMDTLTELFVMVNSFPGNIREHYMNAIIPQITTGALQKIVEKESPHQGYLPHGYGPETFWDN